MTPRKHEEFEDQQVSELSPLLDRNTRNNPLLSKESDITEENVEDEEEDDGSARNRFAITVSLSFALLVQSYLLVSVFPYGGFMAMHLIPGANEESAGRYAGFIASSFMVGRTLSSFEWGKAADRYGRVFVIKMSLLLSAFFSFLFGLASTFRAALILRCLLGMSNGLIGPVKTLVSEYARGDPKEETRMMALVIGTWGYGFLINPAISGYLSDPAKQYPDAEFVKLFRPVLTEYPFLLPNIVGCLFCFMGYTMVHIFAEETLPESKLETFRLADILPRCDNDIMRTVSSWGLFKHHRNSDGEISKGVVSVSLSQSGEERAITYSEGNEETATIYSLFQRKATRQHLLIYWGYSFLIIAVDEIFPLYCISKSSGLGITEKIIGNILSGTGLFYVPANYFLMTILVDRFGFYGALRIGTMFSVPLACLIPVSLITNNDAPSGTLALKSLLFLSMLYAVIRTFSSVVFSTITMTTNRTVPAHQRATMNGLSMLGGSLAKACGPLFGGILFSSSVDRITPPFGSVFVYCTISFLGMCLVIRAFLLQEPDQEDEESKLDQESSSTFESKSEDEEAPLTL